MCSTVDPIRPAQDVPPSLDFRSLRQNATTFPHRAGVQDPIIDRLTGHATPGETARYTKGSDIRQLKQAIDAIDIDMDLTTSKNARGLAQE